MLRVLNKISNLKPFVKCAVNKIKAPENLVSNPKYFFIIADIHDKINNQSESQGKNGCYLLGVQH